MHFGSHGRCRRSGVRGMSANSLRGRDSKLATSRSEYPHHASRSGLLVKAAERNAASLLTLSSDSR